MQRRAAAGGDARAERLPEPIFTPTTKAHEGHDVALTPAEAIELVGKTRYEELRDISIAIYQHGAAHRLERGILLADTKLEFGEVDGKLVLIDELLTPDSSRFWPADEYEAGNAPPSFDKQFVREYLLEHGLGRRAAAQPARRVVAGTRARYVEAYEQLTEQSFEDWPGGGS